MLNTLRVTCLTTLAALALCSIAGAHQLWVNATHYIVEAPEDGSEPSAGLAYIGWGHQFPAEGMLAPGTLKAFTLHHPDGKKTPLDGAEDGFQTASLETGGAGAYVVTAAHQGGFFTIYREDGEVKHGLQSKEGIEEVMSSQYFEMTGKALIALATRDKKAFTEPVGQVIEIVPEVNPATLTADNDTSLRLQVLLKGESGVSGSWAAYHVAHVPGDEPVSEGQLDPDGAFSVALPHGGAWMLKANVFAPLRPEFEGKADEESYTATLTFALPGE